jgi:23S rRNA pseudouridine1911/1915/1917 synthase
MILYSTVDEENSGLRLDQFLAKSNGEEISRTSFQKWIKAGCVSLLPETVIKKPGYIVSPEEEYEIKIPIKPAFALKPIPMDIQVIKDFKDFMVINKPAGLASHGGPGDTEPSLVNGLLYYFKELSTLGGIERPGIVHRLDKPTSGVMVVAKNDKAHFALSKMFQNKQVYKRYYAWLIQTPKVASGRIEEPIGRHPKERIKMCVRKDGRKAITNYKIIRTVSSRRGRFYSLAEVEIETGRTHQIRVHFQNMGCPVVGDMLYSRTGEQFKKYGLLLFSQKIRFQHPFSQEIVEVELDFPSVFTQFESEAEYQ